jgi:hypothetical protein
MKRTEMTLNSSQMVRTEMVPKTVVYLPVKHLVQQLAREFFIVCKTYSFHDVCGLVMGSTTNGDWNWWYVTLQQWYHNETSSQCKSSDVRSPSTFPRSVTDTIMNLTFYMVIPLVWFKLTSMSDIRSEVLLKVAAGMSCSAVW